jgi:hypothetical protein
MYTYRMDGIQFDTDTELSDEEQREFVKQFKESEQLAPFAPKPKTSEIALKGTEYDSIFKEVGKQYDVNPELLKAIAKQESNFDPAAKGESGEIGMMQLMPTIRNKYIPNQDPTDPRSSVIGAAKFLNHLMNKYDDDADKVIQAYNGGETLIDKNPFGIQQTQNYRDSVLSYMPSSRGFVEQEPATPVPSVSKPVTEPTASEEELEIKYNELYENQGYFDRVEDYMISRFGQKFSFDKKEETKKEYVRKFANHMRNVYYNNIDLSKELIWTGSANRLERETAGFAFTLWDAIPIIDGGYNKFEAFADFGTSVLSDPTTYFGLIGGKAVSLAASRGALQLAKEKLKAEAVASSVKKGIKKEVKDKARQDIKNLDKQLKNKVVRTKINQGLVGATIEGSIGAYAAGLTEELAIQQYRKETFDNTNVAIGAAVGIAFGAISGIVPGRKDILDSEKTVKEFENSIRLNKTPVISSKTEKEIADLLAKSDEELAEVFKNTPNSGRLVLDKLSTEQNELLQAQVKQKLFPVAVKIGGHIMLSDLRTWGPQTKMLNGKEVTESISTAINRVIENLGNIDALTIEAAAKKANIAPEEYATRVQRDLIDTLKEYNITPEEFAQAMNTTVSDSAKVMQPYSYVKNIYNAMTGQDKDAKKFFDELYGEHYNASYWSTFTSGFHRLERTSKIWVTSALSTTALNVMGTVTGLGFKSAAELFESLVHKGVKGIAVTMGSDPKILGLQEPKSIGDVFTQFSKMTNYGLTSLEADEILKNNPSIRNKLINTLAIGEPADKLNKFNKFISSLNLAQDAFFRKTLFTAAVEKELKGMGQNLYKDYLTVDKPIPPQVLKKATDEAMRATFSYQFKANADARVDNFISEAAGNTLASRFIKTFENMPFLSLIAPFPRFMANAINFQYRFSPIGGLSGASDIIAGLKGKDAAGKKLSDTLRRQSIKKGTKAVSEGVVGTTLLGMAYMYRSQENNRTDNWYEVKIGDTTVDARAFFPIAPYFAVAELMVSAFEIAENKKAAPKFDEAVKSTIESISGVKARDLDLFPSWIGELGRNLVDGVSMDKAMETLAQGVFNFAGRFAQPIKPLREFFDGMSSEGLVARDPKDIDLDMYVGKEEGNLFLESLNNQLKNKLPSEIFGFQTGYGKESLNEAVQYFKDGPPLKAGGFFSNFIGVKLTPNKNLIEKEVTRLGIQPWKVYTPVGIKSYDNTVISNAIYFLERETVDLIKSDYYKNLNDLRKTKKLKEVIRESFNLAKDELRREGIDKRNNTTISKDMLKVVDYLEYKKLSKADRQIIEQEYSDVTGGLELSKTKDYYTALQLQYVLD